MYLESHDHITTADDETNRAVYRIENGTTIWCKPTKDGDSSVLLANFEAKISAEEIHDDGLEQKNVFTIAGKRSDGTRLPSIRILAEKFGAMNWVSEWGAKAIVSAGAGKRDHLRAAIQNLSDNVVTKLVFTHTGWRFIDGEYYYLHAGGGIGRNGNNASIEVSPTEGRLVDYLLPSPPTGEKLIYAIKASVSLLDLGAKSITVPLLAGIYRGACPIGR